MKKFHTFFHVFLITTNKNEFDILSILEDIFLFLNKMVCLMKFFDQAGKVLSSLAALNDNNLKIKIKLEDAFQDFHLEYTFVCTHLKNYFYSYFFKKAQCHVTAIQGDYFDIFKFFTVVQQLFFQNTIFTRNNHLNISRDFLNRK